ncbi:uncharacterized protein LOC134227905 [Armigeres subalbatus]|uniref:uncharacterized protein LOC134227905 n=1 Tax=Armigeres subalbatus TaxID=124917 RepID=UPI002ED019DE
MAEHSVDEIHSPSWLNDDFFTKMLQNSENDPSIQLTESCELRPATQPGDHYGSIMFRTEIHYQTKRVSGEQKANLIIKTQPTADGYKKEVSQGNTLFVKEIQMYSEVLPAMAKVLKDAGEHLEVARLFYASIEPNAIIVIEDLSPKGWLANRVCIGSIEEARQIIRDIANHHAASLYINQQKIMDLTTHSIKEVLCEGLVLTQFSTRFNEFSEVVSKWNGCSVFADKLKHLLKTLGQRYSEVYDPNPPTVGYNVLNHGDFNWKNILVKKNLDGRIVDAMKIDYQCGHWGSPAIDILYLLDLIVDNPTKTAHRNEILYEYHQQFATVLGKMGYLGKVPSLVDLQTELLRKGFLEVMHVVVFEKFKYEKLTDTTFDNYGQGNPDDPSYQNEEFCNIIRSELPTLMYKGLLDQ